MFIKHLRVKIILTNIFPYLNWTQLFVLLTFVWAIAFLPRTLKNRIVLAILFICFTNELLSLLFLLWKLDNGLLFSVNLIIHNSLWLWLILRKRHRKFVIAAYFILAMTNLFFIEGLDNFNYNTFIIGAFLYIASYLALIFSNLSQEDFSFFQSNDFLLLSAPVLFFFGLSFIFAFKSYEISATIVFGSVNLYLLIGFFINLAYYALICLYILKEHRHANA